MRIEACYDSHVHWAATGEFSHRLRLDHLTRPEDILQVVPEKHHFQGDWLIGFGWDDNKWTEKPYRKILDQWFPHQPVALSRCDAHAMWVNTEALKRSGIGATTEVKGGRIERDATGEPTGLLIDTAMELVEAQIPKATAFEIRRNLLKGVQIFNEAGYTHIRDMTMDAVQWNEALKLDGAGLLTLAVEAYFHLKDLEHASAILDLVDQAKKSGGQHLRAKGIKIFLDGALGSEGAWLSHCYHGRSHQGLQLWDRESLREVLRLAWSRDCDVAVHVIGDEAADHIVDLAIALKIEGVKGRLHLEHGELIRPDTIKKMQGLSIECHMQPCHWLSDRHWLKNKVGELEKFAFPWRRLQEAEVYFDFGSDAPIEPASISRTLQALRESAEAGLPRLLGSPTLFMSHRDLSWVPNSYTILEDEVPRQVVFKGEHLI